MAYEGTAVLGTQGVLDRAAGPALGEPHAPDGGPCRDDVAPEQKAFLVGSLYSSATLRYFHQVLMYVPPEDSGAPFVLGQYGGVVGAEGLPGGGQPRPRASGPSQTSIAMEAPIRAAPAIRHRRR
ncbi:hypothetical protein BH24ACT12_BH24ACT12_13130 [soil metagenome]